VPANLLRTIRVGPLCETRGLGCTRCAQSIEVVQELCDLALLRADCGAQIVCCWALTQSVNRLVTDCFSRWSACSCESLFCFL
jgi:hypothetical protein